MKTNQIKGEKGGSENRAEISVPLRIEKNQISFSLNFL
jgi:hypothetical protein